MSVGTYEDSHAATVEEALERIMSNISRIEKARAYWVNVETDARSSSTTRTHAAAQVYSEVNDFRYQWANVKFVLLALKILETNF